MIFLAYIKYFLYLCSVKYKMRKCVHTPRLNERKNKTMADIEKITQIGLVPAELINDLRQIIDSARSHVASTANYELTMMYWHLGDRINRDLLNNERAEYGQQIVSQVATQLQEEYGTKGFELRSIQRMMQFARLMPDSKIVSPLVSKLKQQKRIINHCLSASAYNR